ncbi:MAG: hypothetical protein AW10_03250 [Candidatus Accumulibacter appositus]|uniref:BrnA antitoxin family protein n=1 Tax=Candidatus Accumulibacter appositus TaxID=1454003 RepID=A0A011PMB1_9PROT|nr:BrnA antitoxin family protein [Accumulibacter sp.]EXI78167.1 MAG: hypothetical protein AW10_03250 [Candidatus Accumulibacter appositus]HRF04706.1 BrnA antitoxin family protein [Accumulibacter sp.]
MNKEVVATSSTFAKERKRVARVAKAARGKSSGGAGDANQPVEIAPGVSSKAKVRQPGRRGPQKLPTKVAVTVRYSPEVLDYFKASGDGWQTRMNDVLRRHVEEEKRHEQHRAA